MVFPLQKILDPTCSHPAVDDALPAKGRAENHLLFDQETCYGHRGPSNPILVTLFTGQQIHKVKIPILVYHISPEVEFFP